MSLKEISNAAIHSLNVSCMLSLHSIFMSLPVYVWEKNFLVFGKHFFEDDGRMDGNLSLHGNECTLKVHRINSMFCRSRPFYFTFLAHSMMKNFNENLFNLFFYDFCWFTLKYWNTRVESDTHTKKKMKSNRSVNSSLLLLEAFTPYHLCNITRNNKLDPVSKHRAICWNFHPFQKKLKWIGKSWILLLCRNWVTQQDKT